jgi:hypothetical protein
LLRFVISVIAPLRRLICNMPMPLGEPSVPDRLAELRARLEKLLDAAMKETDPAKYDELCAEIWLVIGEWERILGQPAP